MTPTLPLEPQTGRTWRIVIPWDVSLTASNKIRRHGHWGARSSLMKRARETARFCWGAIGSPVASGKVRLSIIVRRGHQLDQLNALDGCKPCVDGVFIKAMTPDDSPKHLILGEVTQETGKQWKGREEVEFVITEVTV